MRFVWSLGGFSVFSLSLIVHLVVDECCIVLLLWYYCQPCEYPDMALNVRFV